MPTRGAPKGNNNAGNGKLIKRALLEAVHKSPQHLQQMAEHVVKKAADGDLAYIQYLTDRIDGKPAQEVVQEVTYHQPSPDIPPPAKSYEEWLARHALGTAAGTTDSSH